MSSMHHTAESLPLDLSAFGRNAKPIKDPNEGKLAFCLSHLFLLSVCPSTS